MTDLPKKVGPQQDASTEPNRGVSDQWLLTTGSKDALSNKNEESSFARSETPVEWAEKGLLLDFLSFYFRHTGWKAYYSIGQQIVLSLLSGIGLLMLIPFLYVVGVGGDGDQSGIMAWVVRAVESVGLSLDLTTGLVAFIVIISLHAFLRYRQAIVQSEIVEEFARHLRHRLYEAMARSQWLSIVGIKASRINHTLSSDVSVVAQATRFQQSLIGTLLLLGVNIAIASYLSVTATGISLICGGLILFLLRPLSKEVKNSGEMRHASWEGMYAAVTDHLTGLKIAKSFGLETEYIHRFDGLGRNLVQAAVGYTRISEKGQILQGIGVAVALSAFIYFGVEIVRLPLAELILLIVLFSRLLPQFSSLHRTWHHVLNAIPSLGEYRTLYRQLAESMEPVVQNDAPAPQLKESVRLENVSFSYQAASSPALDSVNLNIPARKMTAIVGPSGAGKSTLADLLIGLLMPTGGRIMIDSIPLTQGNIQQWRQVVGYVPQETFLFHNTIQSNILAGKKDASDDELRLVLKAAAADEFVGGMPEGLNTVVGDRGIRLSGGERQRIALARALIRKPAMLLLDEATSALDSENENRIKEAIDSLQGALTVVVIAHRLSTVRSADHIVVLNKGRVVEAGSWNELLARENGAFRQMVEADDFISDTTT